MAALRSLNQEPPFMHEPELLREQARLAADDDRDAADAVRLAEQARFLGGDGIEVEAA